MGYKRVDQGYIDSVQPCTAKFFECKEVDNAVLIENHRLGLFTFTRYDMRNKTAIGELSKCRDGSAFLDSYTAAALLDSPDLAKFAGRVSDSGEGRWTIAAAIDESIPAPVLSAALYERFSSRGEADFGDKVLSALRYQFGGHEEKAAPKADA